jgi:hypothetical protein
MKKWLVAAAALAFVATASPALVSQAQADPPKNPFCALPGSDYTWARALESWADRYNCWGYPFPYFRTHHVWYWGEGGPGPHRWWWHHRHHWYWHHHHHHHQ